MIYNSNDKESPWSSKNNISQLKNFKTNVNNSMSICVFLNTTFSQVSAGFVIWTKLFIFLLNNNINTKEEEKFTGDKN